MKCFECGCEENEFDEVLGERTCKDCGLVLVTELFEETVHILDNSGELKHSSDKGKLGSVVTGKGSYKFNKFGKDSVIPKHIQTGLLHCNMVISNTIPDMNMKERIEAIYIELLNKQILAAYSYEVRATAIVYYAMKENGTPRTFKEICKEFTVNTKRVKRLVRKINQHYGNRVNCTPVNPQYMINQTINKITNEHVFRQQANKVLEAFEIIINNSDYTKGNSYYAAICWITSNIFLRDITRKHISETTGYSEWIIYRQTRAILSLIGLTSVKELKGKNINEIGE